MPHNSSSNPQKRRREPANVDVQLVEIYEDLANENNEIRLKAAKSLLLHFAPQNAQGPADDEKIEKAFRRLFRGLCSGRKAARLGFSIALTELLSTIFSASAENDQQRSSGLAVSKVLEILETLTHAANCDSGQEERDHHFGRLFGAEAVLKSSILFQDDVPFENWTKLLSLVFDLANKKPWLREECGYVVYCSIANIGARKVDAKYVAEILTCLCQHNLAKTREGVAIWLAAMDLPASVTFPSNVWQHGSPIHVREKAQLAKIMKESSEPQSAPEKNSHKPAVWTPQLHFAWDAILRRLYAQERSTFADIWTEVVDNGLFAASSSEERKYWGFQLFVKVLNEAPERFASRVFTKNFMRSLMNQLAVEDRYLHKVALKASKAIQGRVSREPDFLKPAIQSLMGPTGAVNFDQLTKTKTVEKLLGDASPGSVAQVLSVFTDTITKPGVEDSKTAASIRQQLAGLLHSAVKSQAAANKSASEDAESLIKEVMLVLSRFAYFVVDTSNSKGNLKHPDPPITQATQELFRSRISSCLNVLIAGRKSPASVAYDVVRQLRDLSESGDYGRFVIEMNDNARGPLDSAFKTLKKINRKGKDHGGEESSLQAFKLLYSMTILQVYNGDADAVSMLDELKPCSSKLLGHKKSKSGEEQEEAADVLVEILLSFASKPSQLFRRTSEQVFGAFANHVTVSGLESLLAVLEAKDSLAGQQELFDKAENNEEDDVEMDDADDLDSDVEEVEASENESKDSSESSGDDDENDEAEEDEGDEELRDFDAKLAAALGTHRADEDADADAKASSGDDDDADDDEMEAIDEKLAQFFRARKAATSKKQDRKDARENMINFKNRVLDLLEVYVRKCHSNAAGVTIILPLLRLIRKTRVGQLANKAANVLREYGRLCKGAAVPRIESSEEASSIWPLLKAVHHEATLSGSGPHAAACSQASLLLVKVLTAHSREAVAGVVEVYAATRREQLLSKKCHVQPAFFSDWNNWCVSASKQLKG